MKPDTDKAHTRRRLIELGALGLTSLAGCTSNDGRERRDPDTIDSETDGPTGQIETNAVLFKNEGVERQFKGYVENEQERARDLTSFPANDNSMLDGVTLQVKDSDTLEFEFDGMKVVKDFALTLYIRDESREYHTKVQSLTGQGSDAEFEEPKRITFDISDINLPRGAGSVCYLTGKSTSNYRERMLKRFQFVGIEHNNETKWLDTDRFNFANSSGPHGNPIQKSGTNILAADWVTEDSETERTNFIAFRHPDVGEVIGVSASIKHKPVRDWENGTDDYKRAQYGMFYEGYYATEISHFQTLAEDLSEAINGVGITDQYERVNTVARFCQAVTYRNYITGSNAEPNRPASKILYDLYGNCAGKQSLFGTLIQNEPWNITPAVIYCTINGGGHLTSGVPVEALGDDYTPDSDNALISHPWSDRIAPRINTEYAFIDLTDTRSIGQISNSIGGVAGKPVNIFALADYETLPSYRADDAPDY